MDRYKEVLLSPIKIGNRECPNRFFIQAMECTDADEEGNPSALTVERYSNLFKGEAGMITLEAITITDECRSRLNQLCIMPRNAKALEKFVADLKKINPKALFVFQLTHSGELSNPEFSRRVTVKPLPGFGGNVLTEEEVDKIMDQFVLAARIAYDAGADGIDLKLCHGYLGSQILRPYNDRKWKYGGPWENRRRFAFDLYERISKEINDPNFLIGSKISAWEGFPGGFGTRPRFAHHGPHRTPRPDSRPGGARRAVLRAVRRQPVHYGGHHAGRQARPVLRLPAPLLGQGVQESCQEGGHCGLQLLGVPQRQERLPGCGAGQELDVFLRRQVH